MPDGPPPSALGPGLVDGDPALQLDDLAATATGVTPNTGCESSGTECSAVLLPPAADLPGATPAQPQGLRFDLGLARGMRVATAKLWGSWPDRALS